MHYGGTVQESHSDEAVPACMSAVQNAYGRAQRMRLHCITVFVVQAAVTEYGCLFALVMRENRIIALE